MTNDGRFPPSPPFAQSIVSLFFFFHISANGHFKSDLFQCTFRYSLCSTLTVYFFIFPGDIPLEKRVRPAFLLSSIHIYIHQPELNGAIMAIECFMALLAAHSDRPPPP